MGVARREDHPPRPPAAAEPTPHERADDEEEEERERQPEQMTVAEDGRSYHDRHDWQERERADSGQATSALGCRALVRREVVNQGVKVGVGLGREAAADPLLELLVIDPAGDVLAAQDVGDRLAFPIADAQPSVAREAPVVVPLGLAHRRLLPRLRKTPTHGSATSFVFQSLACLLFSTSQQGSARRLPVSRLARAATGLWRFPARRVSISSRLRSSSRDKPNWSRLLKAITALNIRVYAASPASVSSTRTARRSASERTRTT